MIDLRQAHLTGHDREYLSGQTSSSVMSGPGGPGPGNAPWTGITFGLLLSVTHKLGGGLASMTTTTCVPHIATGWQTSARCLVAK
jgi:hypothetical protein